MVSTLSDVFTRTVRDPTRELSTVRTSSPVGRREGVGQREGRREGGRDEEWEKTEG